MTINGVRVRGMGNLKPTRFGFWKGEVRTKFKKGGGLQPILVYVSNVTETEHRQLKELEKAPQIKWDLTAPCELVGPPFM